MILLFVISALVAGTVVPIQTSINAGLGHKVGSPMMASLISFLTGTLTLLFLALAIDHRLGFPATAFHALPWWVWFGGGTLGVIYLTSNLLLLPKLGAALTVVSTLCGQMIMAICIDQFGWFGVAVQPFSLPRFIGILCLMAGVFLMQKF
jgi:Uncharacterized protein conserved in bacteria